MHNPVWLDGASCQNLKIKKLKNFIFFNCAFCLNECTYMYINKYSTPLPPLEYSMYNNVPTLYRHWCTIPGYQPMRVKQSVLITHNKIYEKPVRYFHYAPIVIAFDIPVGLSVGLFRSDFFSFLSLIHRALLQRGHVTGRSAGSISPLFGAHTCIQLGRWH